MSSRCTHCSRSASGENTMLEFSLSCNSRSEESENLMSRQSTIFRSFSNSMSWMFLRRAVEPEPVDTMKLEDLTYSYSRSA